MAKKSAEQQFNLNIRNELADSREDRVKRHLKSVLPEDVYNDYIEYFVFEKIDDKKVVIGYVGGASFKTFKKEYMETVIIHIRSILGYGKKIKINRRKAIVKPEKEIKLLQVEEFEEIKPEISETEETFEKPQIEPIKHTSPQKKKNIKVLKLFVISLIFVCITACVAIIACNYISNRTFRETFYNVSSLKVNNKIRILHISDLHKSTYGKDNASIKDRVEKLNPDIIIYTGDCLDVSAESINATVSLCGELSKVAPSYYIYGNNEVEKYYNITLTQKALDRKFKFNDSNRDSTKLTEITDELEKGLEKAGVTVLKNEIETVKVGSTNVDIFGVLTSNPSSFWSYSGKEFDEFINNNKDNLKVTAIHEPIIYEEFTPDSWGDLILGGHTHGGTIRIPILGPLYTHEGGLFPERNESYVYGRYEVLGTPLIISAGLENKSLLRINNEPEIVIIDINKF